MKNTLLLLISLLILFGCSSQSTNKTKEKGIGIAQKTANPNTPYIYKKGFLNYNILKIPVIQKNDTITLNELKFNAVFSAMYTKKVMYDKFGKWTKEIRPNNEPHPILLWENVKLFEDENKLFSVYASGDENWNEIYASVLVYDDQKNDCLKENNLLKEKVVNYFSNGIQNLNNNQEFYDIYWKSVNDYEKKSVKK
ncbi:hypothetical protein MHJ94_12030 [Chryseobacterium taklimakanense]|uniref:hypothetical protein n=1 Tax=Chryseobacterium taklimakanense TaxID=536441 RepID=UPI001EF4201C|nr:hypothetical protein [Chryseobacterium taklimakanense]MCG7282017.1 hypothetical protein [Chryseobacterium taklimakanense]